MLMLRRGERGWGLFGDACLVEWERERPVAYNASFQGLHVGLPLNYLLVLFSVFVFSQTKTRKFSKQRIIRIHV